MLKGHAILLKMKNLPQTLYFDFDGTLVDPNNHIVPLSALEALSELEKKGFKLCIATGRNYGLLKQTGIMEHIHWSGYVFNNGQLILDNDESTISHHFLEHEVILNVIKEARSRNINIFFSSPTGDFIDRESDVFMNEAHEFFEEPIPEVGQYSNQNVDKILVYTEKGYDYLPFKKIKGVAVYPSVSTYADLTCENVSKASGIIELSTQKGWSIDYAAFGDSLNDMEMLQGARVKVAMGNAEDELKAIADIVAPSVWEDGISTVLKQLGYID